MARVLLIDRTELQPGEHRLRALPAGRPTGGAARRPVRDPVVLTHRDDRRGHASRHRPATLQAADARRSSSTWRSLAEGAPEAVVEEHVRQVGARRARLGALSRPGAFGPDRLRSLLEALEASGRVLAVERDWFLHPRAFGRLRDLALGRLPGLPPRQPAYGPGCRARSCGAAPGAPTSGLRAPARPARRRGLVRRRARQGAPGGPRGATSPRSSSDVVDQLEADVPARGAAPPSPEEALGRAGLPATRSTSSSSCSSRASGSSGCKESLFFHTPGARRHPGQARHVAPRAQGHRPRRHQGPARHLSEVCDPATGILRRPACHGAGGGAEGLAWGHRGALR